MKHLNDWKIIHANVSESAKKKAEEVGKLTGIGNFRPSFKGRFKIAK